MNRNVWIGIIIIAMIGLGIWFFSRQSPEAVVKGRLDRLCEVVAKGQEEGAIAVGTKHLALQELFADHVEISGDAALLVGHHSAEEFAATVTRIRTLFLSVRLTSEDVGVVFPNETEATVNFTGCLRLVSKTEPDAPAEHYREIIARLRKVEDKWLFYEFNVVEVMEK